MSLHDEKAAALTEILTATGEEIGWKGGTLHALISDNPLSQDLGLGGFNAKGDCTMKVPRSELGADRPKLGETVAFRPRTPSAPLHFSSPPPVACSPWPRPRFHPASLAPYNPAGCRITQPLAGRLRVVHCGPLGPRVQPVSKRNPATEQNTCPRFAHTVIHSPSPEFP